MMITANNLHQNISIFTDGKCKRDTNKIATEPGEKIPSKDKAIRKDNKKLFDRLLLSKEKVGKPEGFKESKPKDNVDRHYDSAGSK